jgi:hypothetical protein
VPVTILSATPRAWINSSGRVTAVSRQAANRKYLIISRKPPCDATAKMIIPETQPRRRWRQRWQGVWGLRNRDRRQQGCCRRAYREVFTACPCFAPPSRLHATCGRVSGLIRTADVSRTGGALKFPANSSRSRCGHPVRDNERVLRAQAMALFQRGGFRSGKQVPGQQRQCL